MVAVWTVDGAPSDTRSLSHTAWPLRCGLRVKIRRERGVVCDVTARECKTPWTGGRTRDCTA